MTAALATAATAVKAGAVTILGIPVDSQVCACVRACVCEGEEEGEREWGRGRGREKAGAVTFLGIPVDSQRVPFPRAVRPGLCLTPYLAHPIVLSVRLLRCLLPLCKWRTDSRPHSAGIRGRLTKERHVNPATVVSHSCGHSLQL